MFFATMRKDIPEMIVIQGKNRECLLARPESSCVLPAKMWIACGMAMVNFG